MPLGRLLGPVLCLLYLHFRQGGGGLSDSAEMGRCCAVLARTIGAGQARRDRCCGQGLWGRSTPPIRGAQSVARSKIDAAH